MKEVQLVKGNLYLVFQYMDDNIYQLYKNKKQAGISLSEEEIKSIVY